MCTPLVDWHGMALFISWSSVFCLFYILSLWMLQCNKYISQTCHSVLYILHVIANFFNTYSECSKNNKCIKNASIAAKRYTISGISRDSKDWQLCTIPICSTNKYLSKCIFRLLAEKESFLEIAILPIVYPLNWFNYNYCTVIIS